MKAGKTSLAARFPRTLLIGFERGWSAIPGIRAVPVDRWTDFVKMVRQLKNEDVLAMYDNIIIDTGDIAFAACEKFVFNREGVDGYDEISYGAGYAMVSSEFDKPFREIQNLGYGLIVISHAKEKVVGAKTPQEHTKWMPTLAKRGFDVISKLTDIISYISIRDIAVDPQDPAKGTREERFMFMRDTKEHFAGSRFKYMPPVVRLGFDHLVEAIHVAIDKEAEETGNEFVTDDLDISRAKMNYGELSYEEVKEEVTKLANAMFKADPNMLQTITSISDKHLGKGKKVSSTTPEQKGMLELMLIDLHEVVDSIRESEELEKEKAKVEEPVGEEQEVNTEGLKSGESELKSGSAVDEAKASDKIEE